MSKQLVQLEHWLALTETYAKDKKIEQSTILQYRLAADQLPFVRQVQIACDTAKLGVSRLTGKDAPSHADNEQSFEEIRARLASVRSYLAGFSDADFASTDTRMITLPRWEGKGMLGRDYFLEHVVPNFYFHAAHTYAILRHIGVPLGKRDYLGEMTMRQP
jgi:uncharacterized protein